METFEEIPLIIKEENCSLFGILRTVKESKQIVILIPALTGTRLGPQNLYVDISRTLAKNKVSSLSIEFPPSGDSFDHENKNFEGDSYSEILNMYLFYLKKVHKFILNNYSFTDIYIGSISAGGFPILKYCEMNKLSGAILISPHHLTESVLNKKNLNTYFHKLFLASTWKKLFLLKINYKKIIGNVIQMPQPGSQKNELFTDYLGFDNPGIKTLFIFGEKDETLEEAMKFWKSFIFSQKMDRFYIKTIKGADHSFFGWAFKCEVSSTIVEWINKN